MDYRLELAIAPCTQRHALPGHGPKAQTEHLLASQGNPYRPLEHARSHYGQGRRVLRSQPETECATHVGGKYAQLVFFNAEDVAEIVVHVLRALRLVVDGESTVILTHYGGREHLHRVVVLGGRVVLTRMTVHGPLEGAPRIAARGRRRRDTFPGLRFEFTSQERSKVGGVLASFVLDVHECGRVTRLLEGLRYHQGYRLRAEVNFRVLQPAERRARGRDFIIPLPVRACESGRVLVADYSQHSGR